MKYITDEEIEEAEEANGAFFEIESCFFRKGVKWALEQDQWISVEDRLPDVGEEYNCVVDLKDGLGKPVVTCLEWCAIEKKWMYIGTDIEVENITHWTPLPNPPKSEI